MLDATTPLPRTFAERLRAGRFVMTAEVAPPVSCDAQDLLRKATPLHGLADAVNLTDGAGARAHMSALAAATILLGAGIEPILQMTCRDKNRIALQSELMGAAALGINNILVLTGDNPKAGDQPDTKPVFDVDSATLLATARRLRDEGTLPTGREVSGKAPFFLGAADMPIDPPPDWKPSGLQAKVAAGARFAQTQFCMDTALLRRYCEALKRAGLTEQLAMIIGVNPLRSAKSAQWMKSHLFGTVIPDAMIERMEKSADPASEGIRICVELIEELATIPGIAGVHIMAPGNDAAIPEVIAAARSRVQRAAG
ncbi:MAG: methylenetetrahydrofolate reductase [Hyphomicrobiales bacterium]|jgi:methylenetetrahydrofolate reductase (NADPH)|nr:methylenetetrahydrofolate reductase [Hyphomicrobiales bacterium]MDE2284320.1 methylenetetrahydrofolate reductase [Hyphomicrobiales bacterium]